MHHEWGTGAVLYLVSVESGLGLYGIALLRLLLIALLWLLLYRVARMRGADPIVFAIVAAITFPFFWVGFSTLRAQLFTLVFLAAQMWMQEIDARGKRAWVIGWWLMLVAWLNLHAGFIVGLAMFAAHSAERCALTWLRSRSLAHCFKTNWHLFAVALCVPIALTINPYGWQYITYLMHALTMPRPLILEWHALWNTYAPVLTMTAFTISVLLFAYCQRFQRPSRMRGAAFLGIAAYEALSHIRHGSLYGAIWLAYVPAWLSHTPLGKSIAQLAQQGRMNTIRLSRLVIVGCITFACVNTFWHPTLPPEPRYSIASFPNGAVDYLAENGFQGNLLTPFAQGAYVSWTLYPHVRVSLDGRYEVAYQDQVMEDHDALFNGTADWQDLLEKYEPDAVLVDQHSALRPKLEAFRSISDSSGPRDTWCIAYEDDAFLILARPGAGLPYRDRRGQPLIDGGRRAFSREYSYRNRGSQIKPSTNPSATTQTKAVASMDQ